MPQTIETTVYYLTELSDTAKDKARAWYRQGAFDFDWYDSVYEDFERICIILGITLKTRPVRLYGGGTRQDPCIWFSGFWSQGDGASFEGSYSYVKGAHVSIRNYAPQDTQLHAIADRLRDLQRRNFYQLYADISQSGRYCHEYTMSVTAERDHPYHPAMTDDADAILTEAFRDLARWLYRQLEKEYEFQTSDAEVDEAILANEYTFTEVGHRFG